jgi:hypothetical protein
MKPCKPEARKAKIPNHVCNTATGRWNKLSAKTIQSNQVDEIKKLKKLLKRASKDYDKLAKRNATNVLRCALVKMLWRRDVALAKKTTRTTSTSPIRNSTKSIGTSTVKTPKNTVGTSPLRNSTNTIGTSMSPKLFTPSMAVLSPIASNSPVTTPASLKKTTANTTSPTLSEILNDIVSWPDSSGKKKTAQKTTKSPNKLTLTKRTTNNDSSLHKSDVLTAVTFADCNYRLDKHAFNDAMTEASDMSGLSCLLDDNSLDFSPLSNKAASPAQIIGLMNDISNGYVVDSSFVMTDDTIEDVIQFAGLI